LFWQRSDCVAQIRSPTKDYDYYSLALTSISNSTRDTSKVQDLPQRIGLFLYAAKILAPFQHDEAIRLLDVALGDLKQWAAEHEESSYHQYTAARLRNEVLALYAVLDPEKAIALQKTFHVAESSANSVGSTYLKTNTWFAQFSKWRATADESAKIALS